MKRVPQRNFAFLQQSSSSSSRKVFFEHNFIPLLYNRCLNLPQKFLSNRLISGNTVFDMKLHNGRKVFYTVKNGEKQGDNNSVNYISFLYWERKEVRRRREWKRKK